MLDRHVRAKIITIIAAFTLEENMRYTKASKK